MAFLGDALDAVLSAVGTVGKLITEGSDVGDDFDMDASREEHAEAVQALKWSELAYTLTPEQAGKGEYEKWSCQSGDHDTQSVVGLSGNTIVISWRGTESVEDLLMAAQFIQSDDKDLPGEIHLGFLKQFTAGEAAVEEAVKKLFAENKIENIVVTGHSLGGALATLCAVKMLTFYPELDTKLITFGCPRVGDKDFAKAANKTFSRKGKNIHNRWAHNNDLVTKLPPPIDYRHTGRFCYLGADGTMKASNNTEAEVGLLRRIDDRFTSWTITGYGSDIGDHKIGSYRRSFEAAAAVHKWE